MIFNKIYTNENLKCEFIINYYYIAMKRIFIGRHILFAFKNICIPKQDEMNHVYYEMYYESSLSNPMIVKKNPKS